MASSVRQTSRQPTELVNPAIVELFDPAIVELSDSDIFKFFDPAIIEFFEAVLAPSVVDGVVVVPDTVRIVYFSSDDPLTGDSQNPAHLLLWLVNNTPPFETVGPTETVRVPSPPPLPQTPTPTISA